MARFGFADSVEEIEKLAALSACDVSWDFAYEQEIEGETTTYATVASMRMR